MKKQDFVNAAKELNKVMGLDPAIDLTQSISSLQEKIKEAIGYIEPTDEFSEKTVAVLQYCGMGSAPAESPAPEQTPVEEAKAPESAPVEPPESPTEAGADDDDWKEKSIQERVADIRNMNDMKELIRSAPDLKELVGKMDEFTGLAGYRELKKAAVAIVGIPEVVPKAPKAPREPKAPKEPKTPRDPSSSNKGKIYLAWKGGETSSETLSKLVDDSVKKSTIHTWIGMWRKGNGLPAVAKVA